MTEKSIPIMPKNKLLIPRIMQYFVCSSATLQNNLQKSCAMSKFIGCDRFIGRITEEKEQE